MEFSKKIFFGVSLVALIVVFFSLYMVWKTNDLYPLRYLIPAVFGEISVATGFYFNKAKAENKIKIERGYERRDYNDRV